MGYFCPPRASALDNLTTRNHKGLDQPDEQASLGYHHAMRLGTLESFPSKLLLIVLQVELWSRPIELKYSGTVNIHGQLCWV